jgi:hypothetical protein
MRIVLVWIQLPQQRAASALPHRFCFAEKLQILAIFGDFWQYFALSVLARFLPRIQTSKITGHPSFFNAL